jgi:hypothetical protein
LNGVTTGASTPRMPWPGDRMSVSGMIASVAASPPARECFRSPACNCLEHQRPLSHKRSAVITEPQGCERRRREARRAKLSERASQTAATISTPVEAAVSAATLSRDNRAIFLRPDCHRSDTLPGEAIAAHAPLREHRRC